MLTLADPKILQRDAYIGGGWTPSARASASR
jgi:hypothetical protein